MKKKLWIKLGVLSVVLIFLFVGCGSSKENTDMNAKTDMKGQAASEFGVRAFPTSIFLGSDGVLVQVSVGHKSNEDINEFMESFY